MEARVTRHNRSYSDPVQRKAEKPEKINFEAWRQLILKKMGHADDCIEAKKRQLPNTQVQNSLKKEILELQDQLQDEFAVRRALEKAISYRPLSYDITLDKTIPKPAKELIKEISVLEQEVAYLEQYLLSLYRKTFDQQSSSASTIDEGLKVNSNRPNGMFPLVPRNDIMSEKENSVNQSSHVISTNNQIENQQKEMNDTWKQGMLLDSSIQRCHSSMSQCSTRNSPPMKAIARALDSYHSLPLSMLEQTQDDASNDISPRDHLGTTAYDDAEASPNWLSEEMIKCISGIYCVLADPPVINPDYPSSPVSSSSSVLEFPSQSQTDIWSPQHGTFSSFNSSVYNHFHIEESKEFSGPYCTMATVEGIRRDGQKLSEIQDKLHEFRSLVAQLENVDPRRMKHEEKLAFWINVHNALVMHAFLVYGIPQSNIKRMSMILKAAYNIGGQTINVAMIQSSILGCRLLRPGQWMRMLFSSKTKFKVGDTRKVYSIDYPEPRLHFALCAGSTSDPAVRVYTPKKVLEDLEAAKEEYIQSSLLVHKEKKLLLPKIVESFSKDMDFCTAGLVESIQHLLPHSFRKNIQHCQHRINSKTIEWIPHNFTFRYLLPKELAW